MEGPPSCNSPATNDSDHFNTDFLLSAYPTGFVDWGSVYIWEGTLLTRSSPSGPLICSTAPLGGATVEITSTAQPVQSLGPVDQDDPGGLNWVLGEYEDMDLPFQYSTLFPGDAAFTSCGPTAVSAVQPMNAGLSVAWETTTSTQFEEDQSTAVVNTVAPGVVATAVPVADMVPGQPAPTPPIPIPPVGVIGGNLGSQSSGSSQGQFTLEVTCVGVLLKGRF